MMSRGRQGILVALTLLSLTARGGIAAELPQGALPAKIDYVAKLNELVEKGSDESLNAEPFYQRAFALYVESSTAVDAKEIACWPTELTDEQRAALKKWVQTNSEALTQLRLGTQKPCSWFEYKGDRVLTPDRFSYMAKARLLLWALVLRAKSEAADGDTKDAIDDVTTACHLAVDLRKRLLLVDQLVGLGASAGALRAGYQILDKSRIDRSLLQRMQDQLMELSKDRSWYISLKAEELGVLDVIQTAYGHYREEYKNKTMGWMDRIIASQWAAQFGRDLGVNLTAEELRSALWDHTPQELADLVKKGYAYYDTVVSKTPFQWKKEVIDFDEKRREFIGGNLLLSALAPALPHVSEMSSRCRAERDALLTVLGLLRYKNDKGGLPADLEELVSAGYIAELPMDPYSEWPLVYRRTEGNFMLYSVGADFKDNGGVHSAKWGAEAPGGDFVFWPVQSQ